VPTEPAALADLDQLVRLVDQIRDWNSLSFKTRHRSDHAQHGHQTELFPHRIDPFIPAHALRPLARLRRNGQEESNGVFADDGLDHTLGQAAACTPLRCGWRESSRSG
jgi:hypothetical protein